MNVWMNFLSIFPQVASTTRCIMGSAPIIFAWSVGVPTELTSSLWVNTTKQAAMLHHLQQFAAPDHKVVRLLSIDLISQRTDICKFIYLKKQSAVFSPHFSTYFACKLQRKNKNNMSPAPANTIF